MSAKLPNARRVVRFLLVGVGLKALLFGVAFALAVNPHQAAMALLRS